MPNESEICLSEIYLRKATLKATSKKVSAPPRQPGAVLDKSAAYVAPESFAHGSAKRKRRRFLQKLKTGDIRRRHPAAIPGGNIHKCGTFLTAVA